MVNGYDIPKDDQVIACFHHLPQSRRERSSSSFEQRHSPGVGSPTKAGEHVAAIAARTGEGNAELRLVSAQKIYCEPFRVLQEQIGSGGAAN